MHKLYGESGKEEKKFKSILERAMKGSFLLGFSILALLSLAKLAISKEIQTINEFQKYSPQEILEQFENLNWIPVGKNSSKVVYVIGAPWCPSTKSMYNYTKDKYPDIQFRYIMVGSRDLRNVQQNANLAKSRDSKMLHDLFNNKNIGGQLTIESEISHDANLLTIENFSRTIKERYNVERGFPKYVFFDGKDLVFDLKKIETIKAISTQKEKAPLSSKIVDNKVIEYEIPKGNFVANKKIFFYAYPNTQSTKIAFGEKDTGIVPIQFIELSDKSKWIKIQVYKVDGYKAGAWTMADDVDVL